MTPELIVYVIVAAGLILWLRNILGTRHGSERERPNPFATQTEAMEKTGDRKPYLEGEPRPLSAQDRIIALAANPTRVTAVENKTAEHGLLEVSRTDKNFDINFFLEGAQEAFVMIVEAFAKGDRETLKDLLAEPVYAAFESALADREKRGEIISTEILAVRKVEVTEAKLEGKNAFITVRFHADEISTTKDSAGTLITGHPERVVPMRDIWTFGRDLRSRDPRWLVFQTRADIDGDNETIPNTH